MDRYGVFLTYDNQACQDGIGAQLQRIVSVYAMCRTLRLNYFHSGISDYDAQIFSNISLSERLSELRKWNSFLSDEITNFDSPSFIFTIKVKTIRFTKLLSFANVILKLIRLTVLIAVASPRNFVDSKPDSLYFVPEIFNVQHLQLAKRKEPKVLQIVLHIRRGELALSQFRDRYLPLSHFEEVLATLIPAIKQLGYGYNITIPSEKTSRFVKASDPKIRQSIKLDPNNSALRFITGELVEIVHETPSPKMKYLLGANWVESGDPFEDFCLMASADILVTSKSSFSYLAGLSNSKSIKIYSEFWHATPKDWIEAQELPSRLESIFERLNANCNYNKTGGLQ